MKKGRTSNLTTCQHGHKVGWLGFSWCHSLSEKLYRSWIATHTCQRQALSMPALMSNVSRQSLQRIQLQSLFSRSRQSRALTSCSRACFLAPRFFALKGLSDLLLTVIRAECPSYQPSSPSMCTRFLSFTEECDLACVLVCHRRTAIWDGKAWQDLPSITCGP